MRRKLGQGEVNLPREIRTGSLEWGQRSAGRKGGVVRQEKLDKGGRSIPWRGGRSEESPLCLFRIREGANLQRQS